MYIPPKERGTRHPPISQTSHGPFSDEGQYTVYIKNRYAHGLVFGLDSPISQSERRAAGENITLLSDEEILETADAD